MPWSCRRSARQNQMDSLIELLSNYPMLEMVRTGAVAMTRGHVGRNGNSKPQAEDGAIKTER